MVNEAVAEVISILREIPGGPEVIAWFGDSPEFGDAEILELRFVRKGPSSMRLAAMTSEARKHKGPPFKHAVFDFILRDMIDIHLDGFGHQNVVGGLTLRRTKKQTVHPSLSGIGLVPGEVEIELGPCAGAFGTVRGTIEKITITPVENYQEADGIGGASLAGL